MTADTNFVDYGLPQASVSPVYADGKSLADINRVLTAHEQRIAGLRHRPEERFWSTPPRHIGDQHRDVLEVDLSVPKRINHLTFDSAHFPYLCSIEYWNEVSKKWTLLGDPHGRGLQLRVTDSKPAQLVAEHPPVGHQHPQHHGKGHWIAHQIETAPVTTSRLRWVFTRVIGGKPPRDSRNQAVAYSLGLRNLNIGYIVRDRRAHVPVSGPITTTTDLFGSSVTYDITENPASTFLSTGKPWRSEPQPVPYAVVSFYLNALDKDGQPQVIDRFFLDPLHSGANVNIYYSNDTPSGAFEARDTPLVNPDAVFGGNARPEFTAEGITFPATGGYLSLDNRYLGWMVDQPWWYAAVIAPQFNPNDAAEHTIVGTSQVNLSVSQGVFTARVQNPNISVSVPTQFDINQQVRLMLAFDGSALTLYVDNGVAMASASTEATIVAPVQPEVVRIGGDTSTTGGVGNFRLRTMVLKQEAPPAWDWTVSNYFIDPFGFNDKGEFVSDQSSSTDNALVRFDPAYLDPGQNPYGFVGGRGDQYANLVWSPIQRDFKLRKGYYYIPPTQARYYKFEFTNLTPEPYEVEEPVYRTVDIFPPDLSIRFKNIIKRRLESRTSGSSGADVNAALYAFNRHPDAAQQPIFLTNPVNDARGYTPTEVLLAKHPAIATRIQSLSYLYRFQDHRGSHHIPRWPYPTVHHYQKIEVLHDQRVAYFVGLKSVEAFRISYIANDDTEMYLELFQDLHNVEQTTFQWDAQELLHTQNASPVQATSAVFGSWRPVRGVQFATTQSPPKQLLADPDFDDPALASWIGYGDAQVTPSNDFNTFIGTTALVERAGAIEVGQNTWHDLRLNFADYDAIEGADLSWDDLEGVPGELSEGGIQSVDSIYPAPFGRIYVAARVVAETALTEPLWVQVVDTAGNILAEREATVAGSQVVEWFTGYTIGSALTGEHYVSWDEVAHKNDPNPTTYDFLQPLTWNDVTSSAEALVSDVRVRLIQKGKTADKWYVDNLSLFQDTIIWEFSNDGGITFYPVFDIRNDPHGVFMFPDIPPGEQASHRGNELCWRVKAADSDVHISSLAIRPWYGGLLAGIVPHESINVSTPNQAQYDHYMPIENDPRWMMWSKPIPEEWWYFFRQYLLLLKSDDTLVASRGVGVYLGDPLVLSTGKSGSDTITLSDDLIVP